MVLLQLPNSGLSAGRIIQPLVSLQGFSPQVQSQSRVCVEPRSHRRATNTQSSRTQAQGRGTDASPDPNMVRELAKLMPDPQDDLLAADPGYGSGGDGGWSLPSSAGPASSHMQDAYNDLLTGSSDLFSGPSGSSYGRDTDPYDFHFWERIKLLPPEQQRKETEAMMEKRAREDWEVEQAQGQAMMLHHAHMAESENRYDMALRLADVMEELEKHDYYAGDNQERVPSWVRAHFILEQELENERIGDDDSRLPAVAAAAQASTLDRRLSDVLPGAEDDETLEKMLERMVGPAPEEIKPSDDDEGLDSYLDGVDANKDESHGFGSGTASEELQPDLPHANYAFDTGFE